MGWLADFGAGAIALIVAGIAFIWGGQRHLGEFILMPLFLIIDPIKGPSRGERLFAFVLATAVWVGVALVIGPIVRDLPPLDPDVR